jgi:hypothetical protein
LFRARLAKEPDHRHHLLLRVRVSLAESGRPPPPTSAMNEVRELLLEIDLVCEHATSVERCGSGLLDVVFF